MIRQFVFLPPGLTDTHENPRVPNEGSAQDLLNWALSCAANTHKLNQQMRSIRALEKPDA